MGEKKEIRHEFRQKIEIGQAAGGLGEAAFQTLRHKVEDADDTYRAGIGETRKYVMPAMDAMALLAAKEMSKSIRAELNQIRDTSGKVYDLIGTGKLSMCDLSESGQLKKKLDGVEHISRYDKAQICKYRETAYDALLLKTALERKKAFVSEEPLKEHLQSKEFFDLGNQKTNEILKNYFRICGNDVLQHVNPASMSEKTIRQLIQSRGKNGFSDLDMAALRLLSRQIKYRQSRIRAGRLLNVKRRVEMLRIYSGRIDGTAGEGLLQITNTARIIQAVYAVGKFGLKAGIVSTSFLARYSGAEYLLHKMYRYGRGKEELLRKRAETAVKGSRGYQAASVKVAELKNKAKEVRNRTNRKLEQSDAVQKYKRIQESAANRAKETARKVNRTKAAAREAGRKVRMAKDRVLSPIRLLGRGIHGIRSGFSKVRLALAAAAGITVCVFFVLILLLNQLLTVFETQSEAAFSVILTDDAQVVPDLVALLQKKVEERKEEAEHIAKGVPKNPSVFAGHSVSRYGHPDGNGGWAGESKITYLDGSGNAYVNGMNNIKDCIAMAYVIMNGDFDSSPRARNDLVLDLWYMMNPKVTYKESGIYTCPHGCDSVSYNRSEKADYDTLEKYRTEGVGFYGRIKDYDPDAAGMYSVPVCFGHKDVEVFLSVISMEEMFERGTLPEAEGKTYESYLRQFPGWNEDSMDWARSLASGDWSDLYGIDPAGGGGYTAGGGMSAEEIAAITQTYGNLDATRTAICADAMSFVGQIPYYWGGKASSKDYGANAFNTTISPDYKGRNKKGLDCSGFVQWVIWRVTDVRVGGSTSTITSGMQRISASELKPGDLGLMAVPGSSSNHVGFFVGYDKNGHALWCHENSSAGNVSVNDTTCFRYYYRIF